MSNQDPAIEAINGLSESLDGLLRLGALPSDEVLKLRREMNKIRRHPMAFLYRKEIEHIASKVTDLEVALLEMAWKA